MNLNIIPTISELNSNEKQICLEYLLQKIKTILIEGKINKKTTILIEDPFIINYENLYDLFHYLENSGYYIGYYQNFFGPPKKHLYIFFEKQNMVHHSQLYTIIYHTA